MLAKSSPMSVPRLADPGTPARGPAQPHGRPPPLPPMHRARRSHPVQRWQRDEAAHQAGSCGWACWDMRRRRQALVLPPESFAQHFPAISALAVRRRAHVQQSEYWHPISCGRLPAAPRDAHRLFGRSVRPGAYPLPSRPARQHRRRSVCHCAIMQPCAGWQLHRPLVVPELGIG